MQKRYRAAASSHNYQHRRAVAEQTRIEDEREREQGVKHSKSTIGLTDVTLHSKQNPASGSI